MRKRRFGGLRLLLPLAFAGCTIYIGPSDDDTGGTANQSGEVVSPEEAQQAREAEAWAYTANVVYKGGEILYSFELPSGDILDFIKSDTLPALPYELPALPFPEEDLVLPPGVERGLTELEQIPELLELAATATPFHRPTFWPYILGETDATSIEDYLARYQEGGQPSGPDRLYAGLSSLEPNRGVSGFINQFRPEVAPDSFSLMELAVSCPAGAPAQEQIGIVISVDKRRRNQQGLPDAEPRLHIEYARMVNGKVQYNWDGLDGKFVANPFRVHHPGQKVPVSVVGGTQREHHMAIFQAPWGDWCASCKAKEGPMNT